MREMPMRTARLVLLSFLAAIAWSHTGCIVFFQKEFVPGLDPEHRSFAFVEEVQGKTLILHGGNTVTLDALATEGMSDYQQERLGKYLREAAPYPDLPRQGVAYHGLLIRDAAEPQEVLLSVPFFVHWVCGLTINLFPIRVKVPPKRVDITECVLKAGMAKANPAAVADPVRRERYLKAEEYARSWEFGIWALPGEQLLEAVADGNAVEVERLLESGAPVDYVGLPFPVQANTDLISEHHPRLNPFFWTRTHGHPGKTPLMVAVWLCQLEVAQILLHHGADVNRAIRETNRSCDPPVRALHYAAQVHCPDPAKRLAMLKMLVEAGADVGAADAEQRLIYFTLFSGGRWDVIDYLHAKGASIEAFDPKKHGPGLLARAAAEGEVSDVTRLIGFGADVNGLNQLGEYPLSVAAGAGQLEVARLLLEAGADPNRKDSKGRTPLEHAKRGKNSHVVEFLKGRGAR